MDEESLLRKMLAGELHYAKLWLVCVALRGVSWDKMPFEQRELAFQAKDAASNCLSIFLNSPAYRYVQNFGYCDYWRCLLSDTALPFATPYMTLSSPRRSQACSS